MRTKQALTILARLAYAVIAVGAGIYSAISYIPFVYGRFIQPEYSPELTAFGKFHWLLFIVSLAGMAPGLLTGFRKPRARRLARTFLIVHALVALLLTFYPISRLQDSWPSLVAAVLFFVSLIWVAIIDFSEFGGDIDWKDADKFEGVESTGLEAMLLTWTFLSLTFCAVAFARAREVATGASNVSVGTAIVQTLLAHFAMSAIAFTVLLLLCGVSGLFQRKGWTQFLLVGLSIAVCATVMVKTALAAISLTGLPAWLLSVTLSSGLTGYVFGLSLRLNAGKRPLSGVALALRAPSPGLLNARIGAIVRVVTAGVAAFLVGIYLPPLDYNQLLEKMLTPAIWVLAFSGFYLMLERQRTRIHLGRLYGACGIGLVCFFLWSASSTIQRGEASERYQVLDPSYRMAAGLLKPEASSSNDDSELFAVLQRNTNLPSSRPIVPVEVSLSDAPANVTSDKPNIFIFVVDSLRKDYLSPYSSKVTFTPSIETFAAESVVMRNAFTHYGATGLSQPSIWVGGLMLHKQYVTPFHPMNSLEKLIDSEGYRKLMSRDTVLDVILKPDPAAINIDEGIQNKDYRVCESLTRLDRLLADKRSDRPVFVYTQPQDIHVSIINREGRSVPQGESYDGFDGAYASRLRKLDRCFGSFISQLKKRGLYDDSIVILTSDHGDSLGEGGRYGHAYTLFPEIIRVPLIIHLPPRLRERVRWDEKAVAFLTDVTPSLYYILGRQPIARHEMLGRPLFTVTIEEQRAYLQSDHLLASSYGPVWGVLRENGRYLYIADAVEYTDYFFDLQADPAGKRNQVNAEVRQDYRAVIRAGIQSLNAFYKFNDGS